MPGNFLEGHLTVKWAEGGGGRSHLGSEEDYSALSAGWNPCSPSNARRLLGFRRLLGDISSLQEVLFLLG